MKFRPLTLSAVTMRHIPRHRTYIIGVIILPRNLQEAQKAAQSSHPFHSPKIPHLYKQNRPTTALHQQTRPLPTANSSTAAQSRP